MAGPTIPGNRKPVSASSVLSALGDDLTKIKAEDKLTWADIARVLGRSDDQAAKYAEGSAEMGVTAFYFAKQAWNGRFTGTADALIGVRAPDNLDDRSRGSLLLRAALELSVALEDGTLTDDEILASRATLESARDAIDGLLGRIKPRSVA